MNNKAKIVIIALILISVIGFIVINKNKKNENNEDILNKSYFGEEEEVDEGRIMNEILSIQNRAGYEPAKLPSMDNELKGIPLEVDHSGAYNIVKK